MHRQIEIVRFAADKKPQVVDEANIRFDYLSKLFRSDNRQLLKDYFQGTLKGPLIIEFDPTSACNFSCPECISADLLNKDSIPGDRIKTLIEEFSKAGVQGIIFIGGGEPLAHKIMPKPLVWAHERNIATGITTNGSLIHRFEETIANCVSWTRVSMDAGTERMFSLFRPNKIPDSFRKILKAMESLAKVKKGALGYSFLVMQRGKGADYLTNATEIYEAAKLAKDIGCDYFEYKPMVDNSHYLLPFNSTMNGLILEQHDKCLALKDDHFDVIAPRSIQHLRIHEDPIQKKDYQTCPAMELRTLVTPSGIYPCPYMRGREDKKLADITDMPFDVFWNSDERRKMAAKTNPSRDCNFYCIRHNTNVTLGSMKSLEDQGIPLFDHIESRDIKDVFL